LKAWLELHRAGRHPRSDGLPLVTWAESTDELLEVVLGGRWNATWTGPRQGASARSSGDDGAAERNDDARRRSAAARNAAERSDDDPQTALSHGRA